MPVSNDRSHLSPPDLNFDTQIHSEGELAGQKQEVWGYLGTCFLPICSLVTIPCKRVFVNLGDMHCAPTTWSRGWGLSNEQNTQTPGSREWPPGLGSNPGQLPPKGWALSTSLYCFPPGWARGQRRTKKADFVGRLQPKSKCLLAGRGGKGADLDRSWSKGDHWEVAVVTWWVELRQETSGEQGWWTPGWAQEMLHR